MPADARAPAELLRLYYRALDEQDLDPIDDLFAPECEWRMPGRRYVGPAAIRRGNGQVLALGLRTRHEITHLLEGDGVALAEVIGRSRLGEQELLLTGAVVVEARDGKITRFTVYPEANQYAAYRDALAARAAAPG